MTPDEVEGEVKKRRDQKRRSNVDRGRRQERARVVKLIGMMIDTLSTWGEMTDEQSFPRTLYARRMLDELRRQVRNG